jgi:predicted nucleic acid-binding protein
VTLCSSTRLFFTRERQLTSLTITIVTFTMTFIDTAAFLARYLSKDQHHRAALDTWRAIEQAGEPLVTSNFVLDETFTLLGRYANYPFTAERARVIYASKALRVLRPGFEDELAALELFTNYADQGVSFTDATSFVLMQRRGVTRAFSFDRHFAYAGFELIPAPKP